MIKRLTLPFIIFVLTYSSLAIGISKLSKETVTLISGGDYRPFSVNMLLNHGCYAKYRAFDFYFYSYAMFRSELCHLRKPWLKVLALTDAVNFERIPEEAWIIWIDDDMFINDFLHPESVLTRYLDVYAREDQVSLMVTTDCGGDALNTGVIFLKKNNFSRALLNDWWNLRPRQGNCHHDEQAKLISLVASKGYLDTGKVVVVPQRDFELNLNTFLAADDSMKCFARAGDYFSQPAGARVMEKTERLTMEFRNYKALQLPTLRQKSFFLWYILKSYLVNTCSNPKNDEINSSGEIW